MLDLKDIQQYAILNLQDIQLHQASNNTRFAKRPTRIDLQHVQKE